MRIRELWYKRRKCFFYSIYFYPSCFNLVLEINQIMQIMQIMQIILLSFQHEKYE